MGCRRIKKENVGILRRMFVVGNMRADSSAFAVISYFLRLYSDLYSVGFTAHYNNRI